MPEYGRNIQNMVDYCVTIQDREERKRCANTIINIMGNMFPHLRDVNDFKHILWDHLAIMATELQPGMEKDQLVRLLANQMKKSFLTWNKESVDDRKIFKDLDELSSGKIVLSEEEHKLAESRDILARNNSGGNKRNFTRKGR